MPNIALSLFADSGGELTALDVLEVKLSRAFCKRFRFYDMVLISDSLKYLI